MPLEMADALHAWAAEWSRASVVAGAAAARLLRGKRPVGAARRGASANEVVARRGNVLLRKFAVEGRPKARLVIVASLINRWYVMDLLPGLSVIERLRAAGIETFVIDWGAPGAEGPRRTFSDYCDELIPWAIREAGGPAAIMGYCMGGTVATMHAALHPGEVRALVLLGTPIDFRNSGVLATWTENGRFDGDLVADAFGNVPPWMLQSAFKAMAAADLPRKWKDLVKHADDEDVVRHFVALESWLEDNVAFPGGLYREYIKGCYQENRLVSGGMKVGGQTVDLAKISMPLLNVIALRDRICEPPASRALMDHASSSDKQVLEFDTGHIGLTTSKRALKELWPRITDWLIERSPV